MHRWPDIESGGIIGSTSTNLSSSAILLHAANKTPTIHNETLYINLFNFIQLIF